MEEGEKRAKTETGAKDFMEERDNRAKTETGA
jgi:hypothetical protein